MPPSPSWRDRALTAHTRGDLTGAARLYRLALAEDPADVYALHYLGAAAMGLGDAAAAAVNTGRSLRLAPTNGVFHYNHALALRTEQRDGEAFEHLRAAVIADPAVLDAHYHLGLLFLADHAYPAAARALGRARRLPDIAAVCNENLRYLRVFHTGEDAARRPGLLPDRPLVSIVIPCVNYGQFVVDAVNSCLNQTYPDIEVVLVEGGSTDDRTRDVVAALRHPRLRTLFRSPIRPVGDNRNFGVGAARGAFICCLDADDMLAPDYIEKTLFCLTELGYDVAGSGVQTFGAMDARRNFIRQPTLKDFQQTNQLSTAALFRRDWWEKSGGFYDHDRSAGFVHEDWNYWFRLAALGARMMNINWEHLIRYRQHGYDRLTAKPNILPLERQIEIIRAQNADIPGR